jgi:hypothetical protein
LFQGLGERILVNERIWNKDAVILEDEIYWLYQRAELEWSTWIEMTRNLQIVRWSLLLGRPQVSVAIAFPIEMKLTDPALHSLLSQPPIVYQSRQTASEVGRFVLLSKCC